MVHFVEGNLLDMPYEVLAHQTNCLGVMGAGIAKQIKERFPKVYDVYRYNCDALDDEKRILLGTAQLVKVGSIAEGVSQSREWRPQFVANLFGEYSFTEDAEGVVPGTHRHTDYSALLMSMRQLKNMMEINDIRSVGFPDHIGCGLAGGNWEEMVKPMIVDTFYESDIDCYIVKYEGDKK